MMRLLLFVLTLLLSAHGFCATIPADPSNYISKIAQLQPGDTLQLAPGVYQQRLNIVGVKGTQNAWITIAGPPPGSGEAIITTASTCCNNVQMGKNEYLILKNLTIDSAGISAIDGINTKEGITHDIIVEHCILKGQGNGQWTIGIGTSSGTFGAGGRATLVTTGAAGAGHYLTPLKTPRVAFAFWP
jgi:hypothetical protein